MWAKKKSFLFVVTISIVCSSAFAVWPDETILESSLSQDDDRFGNAVSIDGEICVVGLPGLDSFKGAVEVFMYAIFTYDYWDWIYKKRLIPIPINRCAQHKKPGKQI